MRPRPSGRANAAGAGGSDGDPAPPGSPVPGALERPSRTTGQGPHVRRDGTCQQHWREDQTLEDLHLQIQVTFAWNDDHLYSFFIGDGLGGKMSEVGSPWSDTLLHTHLATIGELGLAPGRRLLYLFDYGDNHEFDVEVIDLNPLAPKGKYPKILSYPGINKPKQYPFAD